MKRILLIHTFSGRMRNETWIVDNKDLMMLSFFDKEYTNMNGFELERNLIPCVNNGSIFHYE